jgi:cytochrome c biogenesis protein CcdA
MSLFLDIGTGAGLASATGVRPYLPPLLAGGLARGDIGIDFDGTDFRFLESTGFLAAVLAVGVAAFLIERSQAGRSGRGPAQLFAGVIAVALGALLFAGALADDGHAVWMGLVFGPLCAALGWLAIGGLVERVRTRLEPEQAALITAYADIAALVLAGIAVFVSPVALLAIPAFLVLIAGGRRREGQKYAGLRILR